MARAGGPLLSSEGGGGLVPNDRYQVCRLPIPSDAANAHCIILRPHFLARLKMVNIKSGGWYDCMTTVDIRDERSMGERCDQ